MGDQAVERKRLVPTAAHQAFGGEGRPGGAVAAHAVGVHAIEAARHRQPQGAAFGGCRIGIIKLRKIGPVFGLAMHGNRRRRRFAGLGGRAEQEQEAEE